MRMLPVIMAVSALCYAQEQKQIQIELPVISMTREPGVAGSYYSVDIMSDGTVIYRDPLGKRTYSISNEKVQELLRQFEVAKFFDLDQPRGSSLTDVPWVALKRGLANATTKSWITVQQTRTCRS